MLSVVVLTYNEEIHIERCVRSLKPIAKNIFIVDSFSSDKTVDICESLGAKVFQRAWKNYADQFQWGLDNCPIDTEWVMRMDADEYIEQDLIDELPRKLAEVSNGVAGFYIRRKYFFLGRWIKRGAVYPLNLMRIWRTGQGRIENRWMDEHIVLSGTGITAQLNGHIVDDNLNNTRWWTDKHNKYADREMIDILDRKYLLFSSDDALKSNQESSQAKIKRVVKEGVYNRLPVFIRPLLYFLYRYFVRLGFLDGVRGFAFHFFQGYWYRSLVDLRVFEAEKILSGASDNNERIARLEVLTGLSLR
ncbi:glycosyltransferase family 2 protein [Pseudomaricurvus alcaniphilus]|uniref:glycosyltransferase family 2 protein n=1 Tax=Pseudomaricurvus alcaniphilus TaxID=1166482 RepID=UPI00140D129E|nr:glycosyltransferase family 2 protein [Pseudomaricurvus alcaniphilus]NHN39584.1 glycosyltransferase family 2 protein [Pseudomaricurvus alcaniphilus]